MAENEIPVSIVFNFISKGQSQLDEIDNKLAKLNTTQTKAVTTQTKGVSATNALTTSLGKQIPVLRDLSPLLSSVGLGFATGASAVGALGIMVGEAYQTFQTWMGGMKGLNIVQNTLAGGTSGLNETIDSARKNADRLQISMDDYAKSMGSLDTVTHSTSTSLQILNDAVSISHATGLPLDQVVKALSDAFANGAWKDGQVVAPGILALQTMEAQLRSTGSQSEATKTTVSDSFKNLMNDMGTYVGSAVSTIKTGFQEAFLFLFGDENTPGSLHKKVLDFINGGINIDWDKLWANVGTWWSTTWHSVKSEITSAWNSLTSIFNIDWSSLWANLGSTWSGIWRGAVNAGIINPLNSLIALMDKIQLHIPSFDILGWHTPAVDFGVNISPIPQLAKGGSILEGGAALVGEEGPELLSLPRGASVAPLNNGGMSGPITIPIYIGNELLATYVINHLDDIVRLRGGF